MIEQLILIAHVLLSVAIIGLILLQHGKGADAGASFGGGASQTVFGSAGSGNFLTRSTALLAALFFVSSFGLTIVAKDKLGGGSVNLEEIAEQLQTQQVPDDGEVPVVEEPETGAEDIPMTESEMPQDVPSVESAEETVDSVPETGDIPAGSAEAQMEEQPEAETGQMGAAEQADVEAGNAADELEAETPQ